jgi:hypothetical protein
MKAITDFATRYLSYLLATGCIAIAGFLVHQAQADAVQDEKLKAQENLIEILRIENREDHRRIQDKLDELARAVRER